MTGDKAVELINEWLNLAKEVGDMNLNRKIGRASCRERVSTGV